MGWPVAKAEWTDPSEIRMIRLPWAKSIKLEMRCFYCLGGGAVAEGLAQKMLFFIYPILQNQTMHNGSGK
ncbi:unnamed protein product [Linum trigynum]|uniref:Uncharacterized protein n=1 Tax=Linum trigynum TaxID=586398 RepID=A0AAV2GUS4_9ROSI